MNVSVHSDAMLSLIASPEVKDYSDIVLIGRSYGGKVVQSVMQQLKKSKDSRVKRVVLIAPAIAPEEVDAEAFKDVKVLLCWSEDDPIVQFSRCEGVLKAIPHATLEKFSGIVTEEVKEQKRTWLGHLPENVKTEQFHQALAKFMK